MKSKQERERIADDEPYRLAVNLFDLDRCDAEIRRMLLGGKLDLGRAVKVDEDRLDETGVAFVCDLLTAAACCDVLRDHDRRAKVHPTRVYVEREQWSRLPSGAVLTEVIAGKMRLNPRWFSRAIEDVPPEGLE